MVEGTYEKTTARVVVAEGASDEFEVKIGLRQGSVLTLLVDAIHNASDLRCHECTLLDIKSSRVLTRLLSRLCKCSSSVRPVTRM